MTGAEWTKLQALIAGLWPHARDLSEDELRVQARLLSDVAAADAAAVIEGCAQRGDRWPPTAGMISAAVVDRRERFDRVVDRWCEAREALLAAGVDESRMGNLPWRLIEQWDAGVEPQLALAAVGVGRRAVEA